MAAKIALDIAHHQHYLERGHKRPYLDVPRIRAAGVELVIFRTHYGLVLDQLALEHRHRLVAGGMPYLTYTYLLSRRDPTDQAGRSFEIGGSRRGVRLAFDFEESLRNDRAEPLYPRRSDRYFGFLLTALRAGTALTGVKSILYSSRGYLGEWLTESQVAALAEEGYLLWLASWWNSVPLTWYVNGPLRPAGAPNWQWALWQKKVGAFPSFPEVDQNLINPQVSLTSLMGEAPAAPSNRLLSLTDEFVKELK